MYLRFLLLFLIVTNGGWVFERHPTIPPKNTHRKTWTLFSATSAETPKDSKYIYISKDLIPRGYPTKAIYIYIYMSSNISKGLGCLGVPTKDSEHVDDRGHLGALCRVGRRSVISRCRLFYRQDEQDSSGESCWISGCFKGKGMKYYATGRWWFQLIFFIFTPNLGEDEPNLTSIFFNWVGSTTT